MKLVDSPDRFVERVGTALRECGAKPTDLLVVAVSGGPDALSLLHSMYRLSCDTGQQLHCAHLDHGLRGEASKNDATFVARQCRLLGVPLTSKAVNLEEIHGLRRLSVETVARDVRYEFLAGVVKRQGAKAVVLGHTADDQAETILMNIVRGSGLAGLNGMQLSSSRSIDGTDLMILRPLLGIGKQDTLEFCLALGLEPRLDETNLSTTSTRNMLRMKVMPLLERLNPAIREALLRLSKSAAQGVAHLDREADEAWDTLAHHNHGVVTLPKAALKAMDPAVRAHLLRRAVREVQGDLDGLDQGHLEQMARLVVGPAGRSLDLPRELSFSVDYDESIISLGRSVPISTMIDGHHDIAIPGETRVGSWLISAKLISRDEWKMKINESTSTRQKNIAHLSFAAAPKIQVRSRRPGDKFQPMGMSGHKKLQDFMVDSHVPREVRDSIPVVVVGTSIAWVVGWRIANWVRVREYDYRVLELSFSLDDSAVSSF